MDVLLLSRLQFTATTLFHFLFVPGSTLVLSFCFNGIFYHRSDSTKGRLAAIQAGQSEASSPITQAAASAESVADKLGARASVIPSFPKV